MGVIDFFTLLLVIAAGFQVGLQVAGIDMTGYAFGRYEGIVFVLMGLSAVWQLARQKF